MVSKIQEWYAGRSIFVTGGTGFMGKILLEKLLRDVPDLNKIFVLIRSKKNQSASERMDSILLLPIFNKVREINPDLLRKVVPIAGDITKEGLDLSDSNKDLLIEHVSVVFHGAATLRLEAPVKEGVLQNTLGTKRVLDLCSEMTKVKAIVHVSTAFCHCELEVLEEKIYPPSQDPYQILSLMEIPYINEQAMSKISPSILEEHPNSYTFSKRLAEKVASDKGKVLPIAIARPSIVIPALLQPMPGWVDSLNGPIGLVVGFGKGVIRTMLVGADNHAEVIPVDVAINCMIAIAWYRATNDFTETPAYNLTQPQEKLSITWGDVLKKGETIVREQPFEWVIWYPNVTLRTNEVVHNIIRLLFQMVPAYFLDFLLFIFGQRVFMVRLQKRITLGLEMLKYFTLREWSFENGKFLEITDKMTKTDLDIFYTLNADFDVDLYLRAAVLGTRKYCLKEDLSSIPNCRRKLKVLYVLDRLIKLCFVLFIGYIFAFYFFKNICDVVLF